jgi:hypothetical protein
MPQDVLAVLALPQGPAPVRPVLQAVRAGVCAVTTIRRVLWAVVSAPFRLGYRALMAVANWCERKAGR